METQIPSGLIDRPRKRPNDEGGGRGRLARHGVYAFESPSVKQAQRLTSSCGVTDAPRAACSKGHRVAVFRSPRRGNQPAQAGSRKHHFEPTPGRNLPQINPAGDLLRWTPRLSAFGLPRRFPARSDFGRSSIPVVWRSRDRGSAREPAQIVWPVRLKENDHDEPR